MVGVFSMFCFACQKCSVPRDSPADGFPCGCAGERAPSDSSAGIEAAGCFGVGSLAVFFIASSEESYCPFGSVSVPDGAALVSLSACMPAIK